MTDSPQLSIVIPAHDEAAALPGLVAEIIAVLQPVMPFEIVIVDDGSSDASWAWLCAAAAAEPRLRGLRHPRRCGQSAALLTGIRAARAGLVASLDGDGQNDPADLPRLLEAWTLQGGGLVAGLRGRRIDPWTKRLGSRIANAVRRRVLGDGAVDTGAGLKLFQREAYLSLPAFDHMHRFLPALFLRAGLPVGFVAIGHRPRRTGRTHYGLFDRLGAGLFDLAGMLWLKRRGLPARPTESTDAH